MHMFQELNVQLKSIKDLGNGLYWQEIIGNIIFINFKMKGVLYEIT